MTIAACAVSGEGVVLGADSTSTLTMRDGSSRYLNNEQKLFEVGEAGTLGIVTWGRGILGDKSYRTHVADWSADLNANPPAGVREAADRFAKKMWPIYNGALRPEITTKLPILAAPNVPRQLKEAIAATLTVGFCIAGHWLPSRDAAAYEVVFEPTLTDAPAARYMPPGVRFWAARFFIDRLLGLDKSVSERVLQSGKWTGTPAELDTIFESQRMGIVWPVPMREAVDAVSALLHITIKAMKFTGFPPVCGGHVELATITTDRRFRWVRHKKLSAALDHP